MSSALIGNGLNTTVVELQRGNVLFGAMQMSFDRNPLRSANATIIYDASASAFANALESLPEIGAVLVSRARTTKFRTY